MSESWCLNLGNDVGVVSPDGSPVTALPIKLRALIAIAAMAAPEPVSRETMGRILWPEAGVEQRQNNVRQALAQFRKRVGEVPFLEIQRGHVRVVLSEVTLQMGSVRPQFCDFTEPWFALWRSSELAARQILIEGVTTSHEASATHSLEDLLRWMIRTQPSSAYGLIYHAMDLATGLPPQRTLALMQELLQKGSLSNPLRGWAHVLRALGLVYLDDLDAAAKEFQLVKLAAAAEKNVELMVAAAFYEFGCFVSSGRLEVAETALAPALKLPGHVLPPKEAIRLAHAEALLGCCRGQYAAGFQHFRRAVDLSVQHGQIYEQLYASANFAWVAASVGQSDWARKALRSFDSVDSGEYWRFDLTAKLASLHLLCNNGQAQRACEMARSLVQEVERRQVLSFEIYAREGLERCLLMLGEGELSRRERERAERLRAALGWVLSPWDRDRRAMAG